ncbi:MAG: leucine-rich repeat protein [Muribaculaceae bacterium]|nr:leucine-rich repeat protein [Muribaculaceae bacterium]
MKKILLLLMAIAMCFTATRANEIIGDFEYNVTNNTAYGIQCALLVGPSQALINSNPTSISIPGYITTSSGTKLPVWVNSVNGAQLPNVTNVWVSYGAIGIGYHAFAYFPKLSTVHIPSSVKGFGNEILYNSGGSASGSTLTVNWASLNPGSVEVQDNTFSGCSASYRKVNMPTLPAITKANSIGSKLTNYFSVNSAPSPANCFDYVGSYNDVYIVTKAATSSSNGELSLIGCLQSSLTIYQSTSYSIYGSSYIPTSVAEQAFYGNTSIHSVAINKSNFTIERDAFAYCTNLTYASLTTSQILEEAFYYCSNLSTIYLNEGVNYVASRAFTGCYMSTLHIPATLETFAVTAVNQCYNLEKFTVASNSSYYSTYSTFGALYKAGLKTLVKVPAKNAYTGESSFPTQLTTVFDYAFSDNCKAGWIALPYGVTTIGGHAFMNATSPIAIKIPSSVTSIDYTNAFYGCSHLKKLIVATLANRSSVNSYTFDGTPVIMMVYVPSENFSPDDYGHETSAPFYTDNYWKDHNVTYGAWDVVVDGYPYMLKTYTGYQYKFATLVYGTTVGDTSDDYTLLKSGAITIPKTFTYRGTTYEVGRIAAHAFKGNWQITSVTLNQYFVDCHGGGQFENCTALKNVYFNNLYAVETPIPNFCFRNTRLTKVTLPYGVYKVGDQAFANNPSLTEIRVPSSVSRISLCPNFVRGCSSLQKIYINIDNTAIYSEPVDWPTYDSYATATNSTSGCFYNVPQSCKVYLPVGARTNYLEASNMGGYYLWRHFTTVQAGACDNDGLTATYKNSDGNLKAKYVYSPEYASFYQYPVIGDNSYITDSYGRRWYTAELSDSCFAGSTYLKEVSVQWAKNEFRKIPDYAFYKCTNLKKFQWPNQPCNLNYIGNRAFYKSGLEGVVDLTNCKDSKLDLMGSAFNEANNITHFKLPANTKTLKTGSMYQTTSGYKLKDVTCLATTPPTISEPNVWNSALQPSQTLHVPKASINAYKAAVYWKNFGTIVAIVNGDVNGDGTVTAADITELYNYLLNGDTTYINTADVNGDGDITAADITAVYDILLGN